MKSVAKLVYQQRFPYPLIFVYQISHVQSGANFNYLILTT